MFKKIALITATAMLLAMNTGCGSSVQNTTDNETVASDTESMASSSDSDEKETAASNTDAALSTEAASNTDAADEKTVLPDGCYSARFDTDSTMFHVNEMKNGRGVLTVKDGEMSIEIALVSKNITNLYLGLAEDAESDEANWINPGIEVIDYGDGTTDEVNSFVVPVAELDTEFDVAILGKKGKWYDHKVSVSDVLPLTDDDTNTSKEADEATATDADTGAKIDISELADGEYTMEVALSGGSGRATVESPAAIKVEDGKVYATIIMSSKNYDYMLVNGERYEPVNEDGNSTFVIPVSAFDYEMPVIGDTTAMSEPHEIEYTLNFNSETIQ